MNEIRKYDTLVQHANAAGFVIEPKGAFSTWNPNDAGDNLWDVSTDVNGTVVLVVTEYDREEDETGSSHVFVTYDGNHVGYAKVDQERVDYSFDMVDARLLGRYFHLFQRMPSTIDTDFFVRMNVLSRITPGLLPPDEDLVESLSKRPILGNGFSNWASYIARLQGAPTPSKTANNFVRQYGRWPLNSEELHRGEPFPVRLSRFGITIPYDTMIVPPKDAAEATGTSGIAINEVGFLGCSEKGGLTLSSKLCLQWDPTHKEFCEARFFNMPYKESPDGLQRLIARASLSKGYEAITDLAREIEGLTGFCLSAKAFDSLVRVYKETFFKGASAPDSSPFYWYDVSRRIIVIGGNKSQTRGIPVNLPQAVFEGHLLTAKKFLTVDQAVTLQKTLYANPLDVAGRLTKKVNSQMVGRDR